MKIEISYGNTLHSDNTVAKYTKYIFNNIEELKVFWNEKGDGKFSADLKRLTVNFQEYISSEEYFNSNSDSFTLGADF